MSNSTTGQHVTHALMYDGRHRKFVVSGPYTNERDEWNNVRPWRVVASQRDDSGAWVEKIIHRAEFSDEAEAWCDGFLYRDRIVNENLDATLAAMSEPPF